MGNIKGRSLAAVDESGLVGPNPRPRRQRPLAPPPNRTPLIMAQRRRTSNRQRAFNARRQRATTRDTRRARHTRVRAVISRWHRRPEGVLPAKVGSRGSRPSNSPTRSLRSFASRLERTVIEAGSRARTPDAGGSVAAVTDSAAASRKVAARRASFFCVARDAACGANQPAPIAVWPDADATLVQAGKASVTR